MKGSYGRGIGIDWPPEATNPSVQRFHMERCRKYLDFVLELGAKNLLLVRGERQVRQPAPRLPASDALSIEPP